MLTTLSMRTPSKKINTLDMQLYGCILFYLWDMDNVFKALADPNRRKLLDQLFVKDGQTLSELCETLTMTRQAVTKHLGLLEQANLVVTQWQGREKRHYLNPIPIRLIYDRWIDKFRDHQVTALVDLKTQLEEEK
jgi:DNA-binding transcriptional ArsR family regulator